MSIYKYPVRDINEVMSITEHALLSASSSSRWLNCTVSARLEEAIEKRNPSKPSVYAQEGTIAHTHLEYLLRQYFDLPDKTPNIPEDMKKHLKEVLNYIAVIVANERKWEIFFERKLPYDDFVPEGFGTVDITILTPNKIIVIDFKYGKGVRVVAENNTQSRLYALAIYQKYKDTHDFKTIEIHIAQPRVKNGYTSETLTIAELLRWGEMVKEKAILAWNGEGKYVKGRHCMFCKAKKECPLYQSGAKKQPKQLEDGSLDVDESVDELDEFIKGLLG